MKADDETGWALPVHHPDSDEGEDDDDGGLASVERVGSHGGRRTASRRRQSTMTSDYSTGSTVSAPPPPPQWRDESVRGDSAALSHTDADVRRPSQVDVVTRPLLQLDTSISVEMLIPSAAHSVNSVQ